MRALAGIALLRTLVDFQSDTTSSLGCLCTSDQPCWPSTKAFSQLESQLSQPLIYPHPTASPCYPPSDSSGNCSEVNTNWNNATWRSTLPGSMMASNWEAFTLPNGTVDACFLNTSITGACGQGRVPIVGIDAHSVQDVQAAIRFAVERGLKLVVKNTGHDVIGRSDAQNSFVVWTHNMKNITYDVTFVPQGALHGETYEAMTLGAGVQWGEAYNVANEHGRLIVGGGETSVGASGGWLLGGGHSPLSPSYGLGVDNVLDISVVLSTGEYLTANQYQHSDLFWALRGGGGGTYGIVTSVTYRTYPGTGPAQVWTYGANATNSSVLQELVEGLLSYQTQFMDDNWGGYAVVSRQGVLCFYYAPNMTYEAAVATQQGWQNFTQSLVPHVMSVSTTTSYRTWYDGLQQLSSLAPSGAGTNGIVTSRLTSRETIASNSSQVAQLLIGCNAILPMVTGGKVSQIDADSTGLNPVWRNAVTHALCAYTWDDSASPEGMQQVVHQAEWWIQAMYDVSPNDGAYLNEASPFEVNWQKSFFGAHYSMLKSIKDKYDPYRLFVVREGVGSEDWNEDLTCRKLLRS